MASRAEIKFINRELSWLEFNRRVLSEALRKEMPLLERLRFLSIVWSNLDEFFMVRVASVKRQIREGDRVQCPSGIRPSDLLVDITTRVREMVSTALDCFTGELLPALRAKGVALLRPDEYTVEQSQAVRALFNDEIFPILTPIRVAESGSFPYTANLRLYAAFLVVPGATAEVLAAEPGSSSSSLAIVRIPSSPGRAVSLPSDSDILSFALIEDLIISFAQSLFPGCTIGEHCLFRVTRDADLGVDEERDEDFVEAMQDVLASRQQSRPVRLTVSDNSGMLKARIGEALGIPLAEIFEQPVPLDLGGFMRLALHPGLDRLRHKTWVPVASASLPQDLPFWDALKRGDVLLHHPYEQFDPVVRLVEEAASDPAVLSIKITLYRTGGDSPIVQALEEAAAGGKQVTAVVELKARFDERQNISWAIRLQRAGVIVVYGVARLKVHAKALLIVRKEPRGVVSYAHLGTGNYNDNTARLYTDFGLLTSRSDLVYELSQFFNAITGYSAIPSLKKLVMAPLGLKARVIQLIEREGLRASSGERARILAKMNSLADPDVIEALYAASRAGVIIDLNVRGVCMLRPGLPGLSETITVISVIDRYLEHGRAFYFENGGAPEVFCSSADWMPRNLERRVELMFPIEDPDSRARIISSLESAFRDNCNAHLIQADGRSIPVKPKKGEARFQSQQQLQQAAEARVSESLGEDRRTFEVRRLPPEA